MRYAAKISYDGSKFYGWQIQPNVPTIQEYLEQGLTKINKNVKVKVAGAGRTDAGVNAIAQVCSFDMIDEWDTDRMLLAINANIPDGMSVMEIAKAPDNFHARFDAQEREYRYFMWNAPVIHPHITPVVTWIKQKRYNWENAAKACEYLIGNHYFGNFCRTVDKPENCNRTIYDAEITTNGNLITFRVVGSGFLTNMVRIMVGNLEVIAKGNQRPEWINEQFNENGKRSDGGRTFPPKGLFLWNINYNIPLWKTAQDGILIQKR